MKSVQRLLGLLIIPLLAFAGCHELGHDFGGGYGSSANVVRGTVQRNDTRYSSIAIETEDRRPVVFYHNASTRVVYRNRDYPVQNIQPGDFISMRARDMNATNPTADVLTVESLAGGSAGGGRLDSFEGRVEGIDGRRGTFEVRGPNNRIIVVTMPSNPTRAESDRFNRLRNGDNVRIEGRFVSGDRFELENFR